MASLAHLSDPSHRFLELEPVRYEFPENETGDYDANWLMMRIEVACEQYHWSAVAPMLLTWELQELVQWLTDAASAAPNRPASFRAIEPNLSFRRRGVGDSVRIYAYFSHEARPPELRENTHFRPFVIVFAPGVAELRSFAEGLDERLRRFPVRGAAKDKSKP